MRKGVRLNLYISINKILHLKVFKIKLNQISFRIFFLYNSVI